MTVKIASLQYRFDGDASGYVQSVQQVERANARAGASAARLAADGYSVRDMMKDQVVRVTQSSQSWNRFAQSIDPVLRQQARLASGTERLSRALVEGRISAEEHARLLGLLGTRYGAVEKSQNTAIAGFGRLAGAAAAGAAAYYAVSGGVSSYIEATDKAKRVESQLRLVTSGTAELNRATDDLFATAQRNRAGFEDTAALYTRVARNADQLGISQRQVASLGDAVGKAIRISGAGASEASAGVQQFGQALASGRLAGDEFRSVMENTPRVALALADGLGVTIGQLRKMAGEQRLTADVVIPALLSQAGKLREEFGKMSVTVSEAGTVFNNSLDGAIARLDRATGWSNNLTASLIGLAGSIDKISGRKFTLDEQIESAARRISTMRSDLEDRNLSPQLRDLRARQIALQNAELQRLQNQQRSQNNFQDARDFLGRTSERAIDVLRGSPLGASLFVGERDRRAVEDRKLSQESAKAAERVLATRERELELSRMSAEQRRIVVARDAAIADLGDRVTEADKERVGLRVAAIERERIAAEKSFGAASKARRDAENGDARLARQLEDYLAGLRDQVRLNGLSADARREEEAVMRGLALLGEKASATERQRTEDMIRFDVRRADAARKAREDQEGSERRMQEARMQAIEDERQAREDMVRAVEGQFRDLWSSVTRSGSEGFDGLLQDLKSKFLGFASDAAFESVIRPISQDMSRWLGGSLGGAANDNQYGGVADPAARVAKSVERLAPDFDRLGDQVSALGRSTTSAARATGAFQNSLESALGIPGASPSPSAAGGAGVRQGGAFGGLSLSSELFGAIDRLGDSLGLQNSRYAKANLPYATPQGLFGTTTTLSNVAGGGLAGASIGSSLTGVFGRTGPGSTIGGALGGALGSFAGPIGSLVGSVAGSLIGSAFGPRPTNAGASVSFDAFGRAGPVGGAKATDQTRGLAGQAAGLLSSALEELRRDGAVSIARSVRTIGIGTRDRSAYVLDDGVTRYAGSRSDPGDLANTVLRELLKSARAESADVALILRREFASVEDFTGALRFTRDVYAAIAEARPAATQVEQAMRDMTTRFSEARRESERLGLSVSRFDAGAARSFDLTIRDALRQLTDPVGLALDEFDRGAQARVEAARKLGGDLVQVERLNSLERAAIVKQTASESFGGLRSLVDDIRFGGASAAAPEQRYFDAYSRFNAARRDALTNRDSASIQEFTSIARDFLPVARDFLGTTERYGGLQDQIVAAAVDLSGGLADPAGIARTNGVEALRPALEDLTRQAALQLQQLRIGDSDTVAAIQALQSEFQRLNAMLTALLNRAA